MGHNKGNGSNGGSRGRSYGFMLLLAFGAALLGVMTLHKLRERRIFNLLVKEKDNELLSLHLLLQKEKDHIQEVKKKNEEMKAKIYTLRSQKMELDRKLLEMQSTIDSFKDEQRTMEVAFEEKQKEIKMLRLREINVVTTDHHQSDQNSQVTALIESLKQKDAEIEDLKHRLLHYPVNVWSVSSDDPSNPSMNLTVTAENGEKTMTGSEDRSQNTTVTKEGETKRVGGIENRVEEDSNMREMTGKEIQSIDDENSKRNENETISKGGKEIDLKTVDGEGFETKRNGQLGKGDDPQGEGQKLLWNSRGNNAWSTMRGKHGSMSNTKGKKWRLIAKNRRLENRNLKSNGVLTSMRSRKFFEDDRGGSKGGVKMAAFNGGLLGEDHSVEVTQVVDSSGAKGRDAIDNIRQKISSRKINMEANDKNEVSENLKVADDVHELEKHAGNGDFFSKSGSTSEENEEAYKEEIDETEF